METYIIIAMFTILIILILLFFARFILKQEMRINNLLNDAKLNQTEVTQNLSSSLSNEFLKFQSNLSQNLYDLDKNTNQSIYSVSKLMDEGMHKSFEKTNQSFLEMSKHLASINATQANLSDLSKDIVSLQNILTDKKTRGIFGEVELYSLLKNVYGLNDEFYKTQYRLSNGNIADAVLMAESPLNMIVIDSKFPLENYLRMYDESLSKSVQDQARNQFRRDIKKHIDDIKNKYLIKNETAEMAYLFIPAEAIFSEINGKFQDIVQYSFEAKVYLVSPTTLMAFITALKAIYLSIEQNDKLDIIQNEYIKLATEFDRFVIRYEGLIQSFNKVNKDLKDLDITSNKIVRRFKAIKELDFQEDKEDIDV